MDIIKKDAARLIELISKFCETIDHYSRTVHGSDRDDNEAVNDATLTKYSFVNGGCDAFAIGFKNFVRHIGLRADLLRIERLTVSADDEEDVVEHNELSHVIVQCLGTTWDIHGGGAFEKWESGWLDEKNEITSFFCLPLQETELLRIRREKKEFLDAYAAQYIEKVFLHLAQDVPPELISGDVVRKCYPHWNSANLFTTKNKPK